METAPSSSRSTAEYKQAPLQSSWKRILVGTIFLMVTLMVAVKGYMMFGWPLLDSIYMVIITIFGIGYGEVRPIDTPEKKLFTIFVILAGTSSAIYIVGGFVQMLTEGEINRALALRKTARDIENLKQHVIICGFGRIGKVMAQQLAAAKQAFIVVDRNAERISRAQALGYLTYHDSATEEAALRAAGVERARVLATVLPDDTLNVFVTLKARNLNPDLMILARGNQPSTERKLRLAGAEHVILPTSIGAKQIANLITRPSGLDFLDQSHDRAYLNELLSQIDVQLNELPIPDNSSLVGRSLQSLEVRGRGAFVIVGLRKQDGTLITEPQGQSLAAGDAVIVLGHRGDTPKFGLENDVKSKIRYRGARF
uniref:TrkA-N domain protein n=1 Tax=Cyanothece sp. (strain PCC 7425 / ATCC 29141) TaxID=395961 RepID=B8HRC5_CYAP4